MSELYEGLEYPSRQFELTPEKVAAYLEAVGETSEMFRGTGLVPPMAAAALAMTELSRSLAVPPGSVHVAQEFDFRETVAAGETLTCRGRVSRKVDRGAIHLVAVDISVSDKELRPVISGRLTFVLPADQAAGK